MSEPIVPEEPVPEEKLRAAGGVAKLTDLAIAKVAAGAAISVPGVHSLGLGTSRALGAIRDAVGAGHEPAHGISVEVGATQVAIDIVLTAVFGVPLHELARKVREAVFVATSELTQLHVIEVNIEISDVYIPDSRVLSSKQEAVNRGEQP